MKSKKIIQSILSENAIDAKKLIQQDLTIKLGERLAEEYVRVAKKTFNEQYEEEPMTKSSKSKLAAMYPPEDKITRGDIIAAAQKKKKKKK